VVGSGGLDGGCGVWDLGTIGEGHQLTSGGMGVDWNWDDSWGTQPLGLGSSRGGGNSGQSSSSDSLHGYLDWMIVVLPS